MLANLGAIPGLTGRQDAIALDELAHSSMQEAAKIARANGTKVATFAHSDPAAARANARGPAAVPLRLGLHRRRLQHERQDPADGRARRGCARRAAPCSTSTTRTAPASWASTAGGRCSKPWAAMKTRSSSARSPRHSPAPADSSVAPEPFQRLLKIRSSPYVFGGPVVPCYLEAIGIGHRHPLLGEYETLRAGSTPRSGASPAGSRRSAWE